ncbi:NADP-dependent malic enzyme [Sesamum angolense]|uniref:NADP-dependent malic enzyme n=1 Tax=Sesamum angolense TaxID=2727404 RepID=A0AAE1WE87_9LAMI|nr:NADP-dependent malic enzyme [Sesamum angolense]
MESVLKAQRGGESVLDLSPRWTVGGGVEDVYGEDRATEDQLVTPWTVSVASGYRLLRDPHHNKGLAFNEKERDAHYLRGLLPPAIISQELQEKKLMHSLRQYDLPLHKYMAMMELEERNERLFYKLLIDNVEELLPVVYTPTGKNSRGFEELASEENSSHCCDRRHGNTCREIGFVHCLRRVLREYYDFLHEFMIAVKQNYGEKVLIQAGTGIAELIAIEMSKQSKIPLEETRKKIWLVDSKAIKPTALIGTSGVGKTFKRRNLLLWLSPIQPHNLSALLKKLILGLRAVLFLQVEVHLILWNSTESVCTRPGLGFGLVISGAIRVHDDMLLAASEALAGQVTDEHCDKGMIYPPLSNIRKISAHIAANVAAKAYELGLATRLPRPDDLVKNHEVLLEHVVFHSGRKELITDEDLVVVFSYSWRNECFTPSHGVETCAGLKNTGTWSKGKNNTRKYE